MIATWKTLLFRIHGILQNQSAALPCNYIQVGLSCQAVESLDVPEELKLRLSLMSLYIDLLSILIDVPLNDIKSLYLLQIKKEIWFRFKRFKDEIITST